MTECATVRGHHEPRVAVIASAFRAERFLSGFFDSAANQTIGESLVVNLVLNDPTEAEIRICAAAAEVFGNRLVVHTVTRESYGASWNRAIRHSSSDLVAIWNVDDIRLPDSLEKQVACIDKGFDIAFGDFYISRRYADESRFELVDTSRFLWKDMREGMMLGPFFCVRRSTVEATGWFDEQLRSAADFDFAVRVLCHGQAGRASGPLGYYLDEGAGLSTASAGTQRVETTVVQLRYGLLDRIDLRQLRRARTYDVERLLVDGRPVEIPERGLSEFPLRASGRDRVKCVTRQPLIFIGTTAVWVVNVADERGGRLGKRAVRFARHLRGRNR